VNLINADGSYMVLEPTRYPTTYFAITERCVCNQRIASYPFYGMLMGEEQDEDAIVYFDGRHDSCLKEWGLSLWPDDPLGIRHCDAA